MTQDQINVNLAHADFAFTWLQKCNLFILLGAGTREAPPTSLFT